MRQQRLVRTFNLRMLLVRLRQKQHFLACLRTLTLTINLSTIEQSLFVPRTALLDHGRTFKWNPYPAMCNRGLPGRSGRGYQTARASSQSRRTRPQSATFVLVLAEETWMRL